MSPEGQRPQANTNGPKRAVLYLRVSTKEQARRDGNAEGYSLPTQREAGQAKAEALGATVIEEYLDKDTGTALAKRPAMQRLLRRVEQDEDVDYVIVHKLDRWARNTREDLIADFSLEVAGAHLISCSETIDRTASGRLLHSMLASVNEYHSRNMSDEIKRKTLQKVLDGGTPNVAPLGYRNVGEGGRRYVIRDPEPADLLAWAFETYASGDWTVKSLLEALTERGLRSRGGPNTPRKQLSTSQLHRILRKPYYKGLVTYRGVNYPGKHDPIVSEETWDRVQDVLASHRSGTKQREHPHYLKGTIYCGHCHSRLIVSMSRSKTGTVHPYYMCLGRHQKRTDCQLKARPIDLIEAHYQQVSIIALGIERTGQAVLEELEAQHKHVTTERRRLEDRLVRLQDESTKLLQAHYADAVPLDLLKSEQTRITGEVSSTQRQLEALVSDLTRVEQTIERAGRWATNCAQAYQKAPHTERKLLNQAFFKRILITENGVTQWEYNEPFATLMAAHGAAEGRGLQNQHRTAQADEDPSEFSGANEPGSTSYYRSPPGESRTGSYRPRGQKRTNPSRLARVYSVSCLKETHLAERGGFEPPVGCPTPPFQDGALSRTMRPLQ